MKMAYYPGCSAHGTSLEYERSSRAVCDTFGIKTTDVPDWNCCGTTPAHCVSHELSCALASSNLYQAASIGADKVIMSCPSCLANFKTAKHRLTASADFAERVHMLLDLPEEQKKIALPESVSILQVLLEDIGLDGIKSKVKRPLSGIKVAAYYGCLLSRPADLMKFDDEENPMSMDNVLAAIGMDVVPYPLKVECCGASMGIPRRDITARLSGRLLEFARAFGADVIAVACPLCHMNLDLRQAQAANAAGTVFDMPVMYFTQLMGMAYGFSDSDILLNKLCISLAPIHDKLAQGATAPKKAVKETGEEGKS
jgi:heterodisulfide reductase subunit B